MVSVSRQPESLASDQCPRLSRAPVELMLKMTRARAIHGLLSSSSRRRSSRLRSILGVAAIASGWGWGCTSDIGSSLRGGLLGDKKGADAEAQVELSPAPLGSGGGLASKKRAPWRYIALVDRTHVKSCPVPVSDGWQTAPLFRQGPSVALLEGTPLPEPLERFCEYAWTKAPSYPAAPPSFSGADTARIVRIDPDLDVVVPQGPAPAMVKEAPAQHLDEPLIGTLGSTTGRYLGGEADLRQALAAGYRSQAGTQVAPGTVAKEPSGAPVIAIVDSVGYGEGSAGYGRSPARMQHGLAMAGLVRDARCPDGEAGCEGRLFHAQAFPYTAQSPLIEPAGGPLGSLGSLARAVGESVIRWRKMPPTKGPLVVNMSLGWDPQLAPLGVAPQAHQGLLAGNDASVPATVQAVHASLAWAACNQALLLAAAGNNIGEPCEGSGPLAPASWERLPPLASPACAALFGKDHVQQVAQAGDKVPGSLVYAAGGLTYADAPLPNARAGSLPGRGLPALQAVAASVRGLTDGWTGSSVATATLSGIAARAWSLSPQRGPADLMAHIDASGRKLSFSADLHRYDKSSTPVRAIDAHGAFQALCAASGQGGSCPNPYAPRSVQNVQADIGAALGLRGQLALAGVVPVVKSISLQCSDEIVACGGEGSTVHRCAPAGAVLSANANPNQSSPTIAEPWTRPQPDTPICPVCPIRKGKLYISPNPTTTSTTTGVISLGDPLLRFQLADGSWVVAELDALTVDGSMMIVDLGGYRVTVAGQVSSLADLLDAQSVSAGELSFTVPDAAGRPSAMVSVLSIHD